MANVVVTEITLEITRLPYFFIFNLTFGEHQQIFIIFESQIKLIFKFCIENMFVGDTGSLFYSKL
jgi:hypothetical protein